MRRVSARPAPVSTVDPEQQRRPRSRGFGYDLAIMKNQLVIVLCLAFGMLAGCAGDGGGGGWDVLSNVLSGDSKDGTVVAGLKEALRVSTSRAVDRLSASGGYADDPVRRIGLPGDLGDMADALRAIGMGGQVDAFEAKMNEAAEHAAQEATTVFVDAIRKMSFKDAVAILEGHGTAATDYFREKTSEPLAKRYAPIVERHLDQVGAVSTYQDLMGRYNALPLVPKVDFSPEQYVTGKALDGLFSALGEFEAEIRSDPAARTTELLRQVFGGG